MASIDPGFMAERKSIRRRLSLWRIFSFILLLAIIGIFFTKDKNFQNIYNNHIATIEINGLITGNKEIIAVLKEIGYDKTMSLELFNAELWEEDPLEVITIGLERMQALWAAT